MARRRIKRFGVSLRGPSKPPGRMPVSKTAMHTPRASDWRTLRVRRHSDVPAGDRQKLASALKSLGFSMRDARKALKADREGVCAWAGESVREAQKALQRAFTFMPNKIEQMSYARKVVNLTEKYFEKCEPRESQKYRRSHGLRGYSKRRAKRRR